MTLDDGPDDRDLAALEGLRTYDVSGRRASRLRAQCHAELQAQSRRKTWADGMSATLLRRIIGPALAGAWSLAYLAEIIRRAAAVYGF